MPPAGGERLLILILLSILLVDVEIAQLIGGLAACNHMEPVTQLLLLQVLFGEVLKVALGESSVSAHENLALVAANGDELAKVAHLAVHLDAIKEEFLLDVQYSGIAASEQFRHIADCARISNSDCRDAC